MTATIVTERSVALEPGTSRDVAPPPRDPVGRSAEPKSSETGWLRRHRFSLSVLAVYVALGVVAYWLILTDASGRLVAQPYGDPSQMVWFFGWTAHALATGHNPLFSSAANAPYGLNLAQATSTSLLGVLLAPLTLLAGPVASVNVCFVLAMPLSAASAYAVLRRWNVWAPAAAFGGLAFGFSPAMINEGSQHLNLVFLPLLPLIVAAVVELFNRPSHPLRWGAALGGLVVAQYFISSELLALTALMSVFGLLIVGVSMYRSKPDVVRAAVGPALKGLAVALGVSAVVLAYPVWFGFAGPRHYSGATWPQAFQFSAHLSYFLAPTPLQLFRPVLAATGTSAYHYSSLLEGSYLGWGVLTALAVLVWVCRRSRAVLLASALGVIAAVLSFGSYADVHGRSVPMPFLVLGKIPMLSDIIPVRFSVATAACVAAIFAFSLDRIRRGEVRWSLKVGASRSANWHASAVLVTLLAVVGITWFPAWPFASQPVQRLPSAIVRALPTDNPLVLTYPYPLTGGDSAMVWQAEAGFPFRLSGVYAQVPQPDGQPKAQAPLVHPEAVQEYFAAEETGATSSYPKLPPHARLVTPVRAFVAGQHVDAVVVSLSAPHGGAVAELFTTALGPPRLTAGGFELWITGSSRST